MASTPHVWTGGSPSRSIPTALSDFRNRLVPALNQFLFAEAKARAVALYRGIVAIVVAYAFWPDALHFGPPAGAALEITNSARLGIGLYWMVGLTVLAFFGANRGPWWLGFLLVAM